MIRQALKFFLTEKLNYQVQLFETGEECLEQMHEHPDVVILDYYMDSIQKDAANGMEVLKLIRKNHPSVQVIMLSNQEQYDIALQILQKGAVEYVIKDEEAYKNIAALIASLP